MGWEYDNGNDNDIRKRANKVAKERYDQIQEQFKIEEKDDGTYEIIICAIGFKSPEHAQDFLKDMTNYEVEVDNPTLH